VKQARLVCTAMAVAVMASWATAFACEDHQKAAAASARKGSTTTAVAAGASGCNAAMAAQCTAAQAAACKAKGASAMAAEMSGCSAHGAAAMAAGMNGCAHGAAAMSGGCMHGASASSGCPGHDAAAASYAHGDIDCVNCESCAGMSNCEKDLQAVNAVTQVVRLKNGVMYVYTANSPAGVRTVQAALARRGEQWGKLAAAGDRVKLCPPCKVMRGASASGKLSRETVNIEGGCLTLMTSSDPSVVQKLYAMAGLSSGSRSKS